MNRMMKPLLAVLLATLAAPVFAQTAAAENTGPRNDALYRKLGGKTEIRKFTHRLIVLILADDRIKDKFEDADMDRLEGLLAEQFCDLSGGPCRYSGKDMKTAHRGKAIDTAQFNALAEDLQIAMEEDGISTSASNQLIAKLAPMYHAVVAK